MSPNNLPVPMTSLIGREEDVAYVVHRLDDPTVRLLTLTGAGGAGKTRLAVRVAWAVLGHFHDGVWMVSLASVREEAQVLSTIAQVLGIGEPAPDATDGHEEALPKVEMWTSALSTISVTDEFSWCWTISSTSWALLPRSSLCSRWRPASRYWRPAGRPSASMASISIRCCLFQFPTNNTRVTSLNFAIAHRLVCSSIVCAQSMVGLP